MLKLLDVWRIFIYLFYLFFNNGKYTSHHLITDNDTTIPQAWINGQNIPMLIDSLCTKISEKPVLEDNFCQHIIHIFCEIALEWMTVISSQRWFRQWPGAVRQQNYIWAMFGWISKSPYDVTKE